MSCQISVPFRRYSYLLQYDYTLQCYQTRKKNPNYEKNTKWKNSLSNLANKIRIRTAEWSIKTPTASLQGYPLSNCFWREEMEYNYINKVLHSLDKVSWNKIIYCQAGRLLFASESRLLLQKYSTVWVKCYITTIFDKHSWASECGEK